MTNDLDSEFISPFVKQDNSVYSYRGYVYVKEFGKL